MGAPHSAKRARVDSASPPPQEGGNGGSNGTPPPLTREALLEWMSHAGPATGPQLAAHFCGGGGGGGSASIRSSAATPSPPHHQQQQRVLELAGVLEQLCAGFAVVRRGGSAARSGGVDLSDPATTFMLL